MDCLGLFLEVQKELDTFKVIAGGDALYVQVNRLLFREFEKLATFSMEELDELIRKGKKDTKIPQNPNGAQIAIGQGIPVGGTDEETTKWSVQKAIAQDMVDELLGRFRLSQYYFFRATRNKTEFSGSNLVMVKGNAKKELFKELLFGILTECSIALLTMRAGIEAFQNKLKNVEVPPFDTVSLKILNEKSNRRLEPHEIREVVPKLEELQFYKAYRYYEREVEVRFDYGWRKIYDVVRKQMGHIKEVIAPAAPSRLSFRNTPAVPLDAKHKVDSFDKVWTQFIEAFDAAVAAKATEPNP